MKSNKVWFVTGASKGLGLSLVNALLSQGYQVAATSRTSEALTEAVGIHDNFLPLKMDVTSNDAVAKAIGETLKAFGRIDVVVNNAGYCQIGTLEELSDDEVKKNFEVNVFGPLNVIRNAARYLREQRSGHIFNISSVGGVVGNYPGFGIYCSTKFAMAGYSEALEEELKPFGVHTTVVYPGYFRTSFLTKGSVQRPRKSINDYVKAREMEAAHLDHINGNQPNDPEKAVELLIEVSKMDNPPVHFFMGEDSYELASKKMNLLKSELEKWKEYTMSTAY